MAPGSKRTSVDLVNDGDQPLFNLEYQASCGCVDLPEGHRVATLPAKGRIRIPIVIHNDSLADIEQFLQLTTSTRQGVPGQALATVSVRAQMLSPFAFADKIPRVAVGSLIRRSADERSGATRFRLALGKGIEVVRLRPQVPWLHLRGHIVKDLYEGIAWTERDGPEGDFGVEADVDYTTKFGIAHATIPLVGEVMSRIAALPSSLSFGIVKVDQPCSTSSVLRFSGAVPREIRIVCSDPAIKANVRRVSEHEIRLTLASSPSRVGEMKANLRIYSAQEAVARLRISGFVTG